MDGRLRRFPARARGCLRPRAGAGSGSASRQIPRQQEADWGERGAHKEPDVEGPPRDSDRAQDERERAYAAERTPLRHEGEAEHSQRAEKERQDSDMSAGVNPSSAADSQGVIPGSSPSSSRHGQARSAASDRRSRGPRDDAPAPALPGGDRRIRHSPAPCGTLSCESCKTAVSSMSRNHGRIGIYLPGRSIPIYPWQIKRATIAKSRFLRKQIRMGLGRTSSGW